MIFRNFYWKFCNFVNSKSVFLKKLFHVKQLQRSRQSGASSQGVGEKSIRCPETFSYMDGLHGDNAQKRLNEKELLFAQKAGFGPV